MDQTDPVRWKQVLYQVKNTLQNIIKKVNFF